MKERGHSCYLRSDNGSEFIEKSLQKWLKEQGVASIFIEPVTGVRKLGPVECRDFPLKLNIGESRNEEEHPEGHPYLYVLKH